MSLFKIFVALVAIIAFLFVFLLFRKKKPSTSLLLQLLACLVPFWVFFVSALLSPVTQIQAFWAFLFGFVLLSFSALAIYRAIVNKDFLLTVKSAFRLWNTPDYIYLALLLVIILASRFPFWGFPFAGDNCIYYADLSRAIRCFDMSPASFLELMLCGHASFSVSLFTAPGVFLDPFDVYGIQLVTYFWTCVSATSLFLFFRKLMHKKESGMSLLPLIGACCVFLSPLAWVMGLGFSTDYWLVVFLCLLLYFSAKKYKLLSFFFALCFGFTKETGWVFLGVYVCARFLIAFVHSEGNFKQRLKAICANTTFVGGFAALCIGAIYFLVSKLTNASSWGSGISAFSGNYELTADDAYNTIAILPDHISSIALEGFVLNFAWLVIVVILVTWIYCAALKKPIPLFSITVPLLVAALFFTAAHMVYVTAPLSRYMVIVHVSLIIIAILSLSRVPVQKGVVLSTAAGLLLAVCLISQSFIQIDPLTNALFPSVSTGTDRLIYSPTSRSHNQRAHSETNLECLWHDKALEKVFQDAKFTEDDYLVLAGESYEQCRNNRSSVEISSIKLVTDASSEETQIRCWDAESQRLRNRIKDQFPVTQYFEESTMYGATNYLSEPIPEGEVSAYAWNYLRNKKDGKFLLLFDPASEIDEASAVERLSRYFIVGEKKTASYMGYEVSYCLMVKRPEITESADYGTFFAADTSYIEAEKLNESSQQLTLPDPDSAANKWMVGKVDPEEAAISALAQNSNKVQDQKRAIEQGDRIYVRARAVVDGAWRRCTVTNNSEFNSPVIAGGYGYINDLGAKIVGAHVGDTIKFTMEMPVEYNKTAIGLGGKTVSWEITIAGIDTELETTPNKLTKKLYNKSFTKYAHQAAEKKEASSISGQDLLNLCITWNNAGFAAQASDDSSAFKKWIKTQAKLLDISSDTFVKEWLRIDSATLDSCSKAYAQYSQKNEACKNAYQSAGIKIETWKP